MDYRTKKCNHGEKGRCFHCLAAQLKAEKKEKQEQNNLQSQAKCTHPPNMKCLKCMPNKPGDKNQLSNGRKCKHSDWEHCANCSASSTQNYQSFEYFLSRLQEDCKHKKPCKKCVPPLSRKTYGVDLECKNHLPYPQAQCDSCMAPTISIGKQIYSHVQKVVIRTTAIYRITESKLIGILLGREEKGVLYVEDVYFPPGQSNSNKDSGFFYISPQILDKYYQIFAAIGLEQIGLIYSSPQLDPATLMLSSIFQEYAIKFNRDGYQISKFITMRLHWDQINPYFECFMVSDLFQALHKHKLTFETASKKDYFQLITAKNDRDSASPSFLRGGIETDILYFKEIIVWIQTIYEQSFFTQNATLFYPYFTLENQKVQNMEMFISIQTEQDSIQKYRNVQFLLHLDTIFGRQSTMVFLNGFIFEAPELFISQKLQQYERKNRARMENMEEMSESMIYENFR